MDLMLQFIMPVLAQGVPFITVDQIIDNLDTYDLGITIDPDMVTRLLNPAHSLAVDHIDGNKLYLKIKSASSEISANSDEGEYEEEDVNAQKVRDDAIEQAERSIKGQQ